jgi:hypothetical protein
MNKILFCLFLLSVSLTAHAHSGQPSKSEPLQGATYEIIVLDADQNAPLELARVSLYRGTAFVAGKVTNVVGSAAFRDIPSGRYERRIARAGYIPMRDTITISGSALDTVFLHEVATGEVVVHGSKEPPVTSFDPVSGNQVFEAEAYHPAPTARMTQLVQQNMLGAARAPTGEVHVRGQHGEFTYYVDGAPVPLGVFGGLNEVVDPAVIARAVFWSGGWPAEYGGQMAAIVDVQNRVPSGRFHLDLSSYAGSYALASGRDSLLTPKRAINSNGQELSMSEGFGKFGFFLSGARQESDRRIDPPTPNIFHDHGFDYFLYGKADYILSDHDYLTLNLNYGNTYTQVPFDSVNEGPHDDHQNTTNAFQTLTYYRTISTEADHESNLLVAGYAREGGLIFTPGTIDRGSFQAGPNDSSTLVVGEDRSFSTIGIRTRFEKRLSHAVQLVAGFLASTTNGRENFSFGWPNDGHVHPAMLIEPLNVNYSGSDFGIFGQSEWHPFEWTHIDAGLRYDQHVAPDIPFTSDISPRLKLSFDIEENTTAYLYYGHLFMPNNIEGLRSLATRTDSTASAEQGTLPERDDFYEGVLQHSFEFGLRAKAAYFLKEAVPGVDDETIGSSAVKTPVNLSHVHTKGLELGLSYAPTESDLSGYVNAAIIHAYGSGAITGGFLSMDDAGSVTDLDHDQRLSIVTAINYAPTDWYANLTAIYGSGLTNGNPEGLPFDTGLFAFNQFAHVTPSWILNAALGYRFSVSGAQLEPSLYVTNLLDHRHLLKGAFFSGASWEELRNVVLKIGVHI